MTLSPHQLGKSIAGAIVTHPLWELSVSDAHIQMRRRFLERMMRRRSGPDPYTLLSCGLDSLSLSILLATWKQSLCDALVLTGDQGSTLRNGLRRKVSILTDSMLEYHPGKQYDFVYSWETVTGATLTAKYIQHLHLLLVWGGEGLIIISKAPFRVSFTNIVHLFYRGSRDEVHEIVHRIQHSGFSIESVRPAECTFPLFRSSWLDMGVWWVLSFFRYHRFLSPFMTHVGIHFKKI
jgi:hypothetical protein